MTTSKPLTLDDLGDTVTLVQLADLLQVSRQSIYARLSDGTFLPQPFQLNPHRWKKADVQALLDGEFREAIERLRADKRRRLKRVS